MHKPGTIVGKRYRCRHLLAEGGMAEVYLAEKIDENGASQFIALKRLLPSLAQNPIFADMFAYEAALTSSFSHKNIVRCEQFFREGEDFYMALEFVLGKEVGAIKAASSSWHPLERVKLALAIGLGVVDALHYVHTKVDQFGKPCAIVHGDISPQNLMIDIAGDIKLYDFGAAKTGLSSPKFEEKLVRGNPRYMSPEQMAGESIQASSDIFSLSLILVEIVLGDARIDRNDAQFHQKINDGLTSSLLPKNVQCLLQDLFSCGLAHNCEMRFADCEDFGQALRELASEVGLFDAQHYLEQIIKADGPNLSSKPLRRQNASGMSNFIYLSLATMLVGCGVWLMIDTFATRFEPKHQRKAHEDWPAHKAQEHGPEQDIAGVVPMPLVETAVSDSKVRERAVKKQGSLSIKVHPWAEVFIDGQFFGSTPMSALSLPEGNYLVQLRNPDVSAVALKTVKIYADKRTELVHNF